MKLCDNYIEFIIALTEEFKKQNISYCIFKNYQDIDQKETGDFDFLISKKDRQRIRRIVINLSHFFGLKCTHRNKVWFDRYVLYNEAENDKLCYVTIDFFHRMEWWGLKIINTEKVIKWSKPFENYNYYVPDRGLEAFLVYIYPTISGGVLKDRYKPLIFENVTKNEFNIAFKSIFGPKITEKVIILLKAYQFKIPRLLLMRMRLKLFFKNLSEDFIGTFSFFVLNVIQAISNMLFPKGVWVALLGPDGCGKSTVSNVIKNSLERKIFGKIEIIHFRPSLLPSLSKLFTGVDSGSNPDIIKNPGVNKHSNSIVSFLRLLYYFIDYLLGFYIKVRTKLYREQLIIFDRYFYNFVVDPERSRVNLPYWLRLIFAFLVPSPDLIVFLHASENTIYKRKQELTMNQIESQLVRYGDFCRRFKHCRVVDAELPPEEVAARVEKLIFDEYLRKVGKGGYSEE